MVPRVSKTKYSQSMKRAYNLVEVNCVININIIGEKLRTAKVRMNCPMKGNI